MGQARHRRSRQTAAIGNFQIAEPRLMAFEAAQYVERARHHLNNVALTRKIAGEHSLLTEPLRASSHALPTLHSVIRNKIPLAEQATSGNLRPQQKAVHEGSCSPVWGGSEVLFPVAASPSRELLNPTHTEIISFQCPFESEVRSEPAATWGELRIRDTSRSRRTECQRSRL